MQSPRPMFNTKVPRYHFCGLGGGNPTQHFVVGVTLPNSKSKVGHIAIFRGGGGLKHPTQSLKAKFKLPFLGFRMGVNSLSRNGCVFSETN